MDELVRRLQGGPCQGTDRELWREREGDYYADSLHVTEGGGIGMNCGGRVIVMPIRKWHALANRASSQPSSALVEKLREIAQACDDHPGVTIDQAADTLTRLAAALEGLVEAAQRHNVHGVECACEAIVAARAALREVGRG